MHSAGSMGAVTARHMPLFAVMLMTHMQTLADAVPPAPALTALYTTLMAVTAVVRAPSLMGYFVTDTKR